MVQATAVPELDKSTAISDGAPTAPPLSEAEKKQQRKEEALAKARARREAKMNAALPDT